MNTTTYDHNSLGTPIYKTPRMLVYKHLDRLQIFNALTGQRVTAYPTIIFEETLDLLEVLEHHDDMLRA